MGLFNGRKEVTYLVYNASAGRWVNEEEMEQLVVAAYRCALNNGMSPAKPTVNDERTGYVIAINGGGRREAYFGSINPEITFDLAMSKKEIAAFWKSIQEYCADPAKTPEGCAPLILV